MTGEEFVENIKSEDDDFNLQFASITDNLVKVYIPSRLSKNSFNYNAVKTALDNPTTESNIKKLQETSDFLYKTNGQYKRLIDLFSTMMNYDMILTPYDVKEGVDDTKTLRTTYLNASNWLERFSYKYEFQKITESLVKYGEYFGYLTESDGNITFTVLPREYCKLGGFIDEVGVVSFDFSFFNSDTEKKLATFPSEFTSIYKAISRSSDDKRRDGTSGKWYTLSEKSVVFTLDQNRRKSLPLFAGSFLDLIELEDYKALTKENAELENYALLHLKSPWKKDPRSIKDALISLPQLAKFHSNASRNTPKKVGTAADMLDWELFKFGSSDGSSNSGVRKNVKDANDRIYDSAGVANALFNNASNTIEGIKKSIQADEAILFKMLRQYEMFLMRELKNIKNVNYNWKAKFLDTTVFNQSDKMTMYKDAASSGGSKFLFLASTGLTPVEQVKQLEWENKLGILDMMQPLKISYTQTDNNEEKVEDNIEEDIEPEEEDGNFKKKEKNSRAII